MKKLLSIALSSVLLTAGISCGGQKSKNVAEATAIDTTITQVKHPEWSRNAVIYEVNLRQYTKDGTIKAFQEHLPRLKELGVDILWFMPIHPISKLNRKGELGSYYAVQDYKAVNPDYGTMEDFKSMVKKAHEMGFKVILDWVPNHSGCDNKWVAEHPDWYVKDSLGKMVGPYDWTDVYKFDYSNKNMRAAMVDALKFWVKDVDIDGYRCDVASEVPTDFWNNVRPALDSIKPVFMLAESPAADLVKKAFDMNYNWPMKDLMNEISLTSGENKRHAAKKDKAPIKTALSIDSLLAVQAKDYVKDTYMMNMITNHDLNSWDGTEMERYGKGLETFAILSYTLPGMPLIYTGQETGMNHAFEFFKKDVSPNWTKNKFFDFYKKLNELKHSQSALNAGIEGAPMMRYNTVSPSAFIFSRTNDDGGIYVFTNLSGKPVKLEYTDLEPKEEDLATNIFTGKAEKFPTTLAPWEYRVYTVK
ncbi:MAG: alpha-amylase family glycosyl hydrolase [Muribaculaceae bacterium]